MRLMVEKKHPGRRASLTARRRAPPTAGRGRAPASPCRSRRHTAAGASRHVPQLFPEHSLPEYRSPGRAASATCSGSAPMSSPVTVAPSRAMLSARMPPPQPTSRTFFTEQAAGAFGNIAQPQRVDAVERFELALQIPPARGDGFEFGDFSMIDVRGYRRFSAFMGAFTPFLFRPASISAARHE